MTGSGPRTGMFVPGRVGTSLCPHFNPGVEHSGGRCFVTNGLIGTILGAIQHDGSFIYEPNDHFFGTDSFTYVASDGVRTSPIATVTIAVAAVDEPTVAAVDGVLANAVDVRVFSASIFQVLQEAGSHRRQSNDAPTSVRRIASGGFVPRRISHGPSSRWNLDGVDRRSNIATGQIGVNTGVAKIIVSADNEGNPDDVKEPKRDEPRSDRKRRRPKEHPTTNESSSDAARRAHHEAVAQLRIDKPSMTVESLAHLASGKIEAWRRRWNEASAIWSAPIDVAADLGATQAPPLAASCPDATESSDDLSIGTVVTITAAAGAIPLFVTGLKQYKRRSRHRVLSTLVHRLRDRATSSQGAVAEFARIQPWPGEPNSCESGYKPVGHAIPPGCLTE